MGHSCFQYTD